MTINQSKSIKVAVWNYYEEITTKGFLFHNSEASIGYNLLKPWCELYNYCLEKNIKLCTLDEINNIEDVDVAIFMDRPRTSNPIVDAILNSKIIKYLIIYECPVIKSDNWDAEYHAYFDRVYTWNDDIIDNIKYFKVNFASDGISPFDFEELKANFNKRNFLTIISGKKVSNHPNELYSHRSKIINWYEKNAINDFDLYGHGWDKNINPSYCGSVSDKLRTLSTYKYSICYENSMGYNGYITEKIFDCFLSGVVPVYGGAPNISTHIPEECYIHINKFSSIFELHTYLKSINSKTHSDYLDNIKNYLNSEKFSIFSTKKFKEDICSAIVHDVKAMINSSKINHTDTTCNANTSDLSANKSQISNGKEYPKKLEINIANTNKSSIINDLKKLNRKNLIICIGYGDELDVYIRARSLWQFYASHFPELEIIFFRNSNNIRSGEVIHNDYDLLFGTYCKLNAANFDVSYANTGRWAPDENRNVIDREISLYNYLLKKHKERFFLYHATITSVVDFRGLLSFINLMPEEGCYAGMPGSIKSPEQFKGLNFVCGTNNLLSSDVIKLLVKRYDPDDPLNALPNDIWKAELLKDVPRRILPFFSFVKPRSYLKFEDEVFNISKQLISEGHFHFRIKTTKENEDSLSREDVDPLIMMNIILAILNSSPTEISYKKFQKDFEIFTNSEHGNTFNYKSEVALLKGQRGFPLNDVETSIAYPDLY